MNRSTLLLADLPADTWENNTNLQIGDRYAIPPPVVRRFRKEAKRPTQPLGLTGIANHHSPK